MLNEDLSKKQMRWNCFYNEILRISGGKMNTPTLETERLILRKFSENDFY